MAGGIHFLVGVAGNQLAQKKKGGDEERRLIGFGIFVDLLNDISSKTVERVMIQFGFDWCCEVRILRSMRSVRSLSVHASPRTSAASRWRDSASGGAL